MTEPIPQVNTLDVPPEVPEGPLPPGVSVTSKPRLVQANGEPDVEGATKILMERGWTHDSDLDDLMGGTLLGAPIQDQQTLGQAHKELLERFPVSKPGVVTNLRLVANEFAGWWRGKSDRELREEELEIKGDPFGDDITDTVIIRPGVGVINATINAINLPADIFGAPRLLSEEAIRDAFGEPRQTMGALVQGAAQFTTGFVSGGAALKSVGKAATRTGKGTVDWLKNYSLQITAQGAIADTLVWDPDHGNLSTLVKYAADQEDLPWLLESVTKGAVATGVPDLLDATQYGRIGGRIANAIEGSMIGMPIDTLFHALGIGARAMARDIRSGQLTTPNFGGMWVMESALDRGGAIVAGGHIGGAAPGSGIGSAGIITQKQAKVMGKYLSGQALRREATAQGIASGMSSQDAESNAISLMRTIISDKETEAAEAIAIRLSMGIDQPEALAAVAMARNGMGIPVGKVFFEPGTNGWVVGGRTGLTPLEFGVAPYRASVLSGVDARELMISSRENSGFTWHVKGRKSPTKGFAVSRYPEVGKKMPAADISESVIFDYANSPAVRQILDDNPNAHVGGWHDEETGLYWLDVSEVLPTEKEALQVAQVHGELAIFDYTTFESIYLKDKGIKPKQRNVPAPTTEPPAPTTVKGTGQDNTASIEYSTREVEASGDEPLKILWDGPSGETLSFTPEQFKKFTAFIKSENAGIVPEAWRDRASGWHEQELKRFKDGERPSRPSNNIWAEDQIRTDLVPQAEAAPWYNLDGVNQRGLEAAAARFTDDAAAIAVEQRALFQNDRGVVFINPETGDAWIKALNEPDFSTAIHETAHIFRDQLFRRTPKHQGMAGVDEGVLKEVEDVFGAVDGKWSREAEERFAVGLEQFILNGELIPGVDPRAMQLIAARMRDAYAETMAMGNDLINVTPKMTKMYKKLLQDRTLPLQYAPGRYMQALDYTSVLGRIKEWDEDGVDWLEHIKPEDLIGTSRMAESGRIRFQEMDELGEEYLMFSAALNDLTRETIEGDVLLRGRSMQDIGKESLGLLNQWLARNEGDIVKTLREQLDNASLIRPGDKKSATTMMVAANVYLRDRIIRLHGLATNASGGSVKDLALFHHALAEYEHVAAMVSNARTTWGQMGHALKSNELPSAEAVANSVEDAESLLKTLGADGPTGTELADIISKMDINTMDGIGSIAKAARDSSKGRNVIQHAMDVVYEAWINGLLSRPSTFLSLSIASPMIIMPMRGAEKLVGGLMRGIGTGDFSVATEVFENAWRNTRNSLTAMKFAGKAYKDVDSVLLPGKAWEDSMRSGLRGTTDVPDSVRPWFQDAMQHVGRFARRRVVGGPLNVLLAVDEWWRQIAGRSAAESIIVREETQAMINRLNLPEGATIAEQRAALKPVKDELSSLVQARMDEVIHSGKLQNQNDAMQRAAALPDVQAIGDPLDRAYEIARRGEQWTDRNGAVATRVEDYARRPTFQYELGPAGTMASAFIGAFPGLKWLVPFRKTPMNLFREFGSYVAGPTVVAGSEIFGRSKQYLAGKGFTIPQGGVLHDAGSRMMADLASGDPVRIAEVRGRQAMAIAYFTGGWYLASSGALTGNGPQDLQKRKTLMSTGWQPYSIKTPDGWIQYKKMDPASMILGTMADVYEILQSDADEGVKQGIVSATMTAFAEGLIDNIRAKSYLTGLTAASEVYTGTREPDRWLRDQAATATPLSQFQRAMQQIDDPYMREIRTVADSIRVNTWMLGGGQDVPPRFDMLGEPIQMKDVIGENGVEWFNFVSPMRFSPKKGDAVWDELARIEDVFGSPAETRNNINLINYKNERGWTAYDTWQDLTGRVEINGRTLREELAAMFNSQEYQSASGHRLQSEDGAAFISQKGLMIGTAIRGYRDEAFAVLLESDEYPRLIVDFERMALARDLDAEIGTAAENEDTIRLRDELEGLIQQ